MPEDSIYKTLLREFLPDFLRLFFPEIAERLDLGTIEFLDREEFTDLPAGRRREVDVLARVKALAGEPELILIHVEVQGRRQADFRERMWRYYSLLSLRHPEPVCPLALLIYGGVGGVGWQTYRRAVLVREILVFHFGQVGLLDLRDEEYLITHYPLGIALAARMRHPPGSKSTFKLRCAEELEHAPLNPARKLLLAQAVDHFLVLPHEQEDEFHRLVEQRGLKEVTPMLTGSERLGIVRGKQEALVRVLKARFGDVPSDLLKQVQETYGSRALNNLIDFAVSAASLTDVANVLAASVGPENGRGAGRRARSRRS